MYRLANSKSKCRGMYPFTQKDRSKMLSVSLILVSHVLFLCVAKKDSVTYKISIEMHALTYAL